VCACGATRRVDGGVVTGGWHVCPLCVVTPCGERPPRERRATLAPAQAELFAAQIRSHLRDGIPPPIESQDATLEGVEPEPVGVAQHHTIGGRGAVARLREAPTP
jgi:hypothetical protein